MTRFALIVSLAVLVTLTLGRPTEYLAVLWVLVVCAYCLPERAR